MFLLLTIPLARFTDHLIARDQARLLAGVRLWAERTGVRRPGDPAFVTAGEAPGVADAAEALRIEGLRKSFGAEEVLRGIDLAVDLDEVTSALDLEPWPTCST